MLKPAKNPIQQTIIVCLITLLVTFSKHGGFVLGFVLLFLIPSTVKSIYLAFVKNDRKKQRSIQMLLWAVTCLAITTHHFYLYKTAQNYSVKVSSAIVQFYKVNGSYPESADILGFDKQEMKNYGVYYSYTDNSPFLFYPATWIVFDSYVYDFNLNKWVYDPS